MKSFSKQIFWFCSAMLLLVVVAFPRYTRPGTEATLAWDVSGYYLYLPAVFIYDDLEKVAFLSQIIEKYQPSFTPDQAFPIENGNQVMKYSAGMAVLYLPFFAIGHTVAKLTGYPADGFSLPYQAAIHLGGVLFSILGLWFLRKSLLRYFPDRTMGWVLLLVALGTNFFNYATFDAANAHAWLFCLMALLVHLTIRYHERPSLKLAIGLGACLGLAALVRPTEILYAIIPLLWGVGSLAALRQRLVFFKNNFTHLLAAGLVTAAIGFIQLAYWKQVSGHWFVYSYGDQGFSFLHPHFVDVFFSYRKGWLVHTPLMVFALIGFLPLTPKGEPKTSTPRNSEMGDVPTEFPQIGSPFGVSGKQITNHQSLITSILLFFLLNTWVVCAWDIWWYGGAFGQRAMVQSYPLLAFPLATFLVFMVKKPWSKWLFGTIMAGCVALNLFQTYQAHWGPWETDAMNGAYYWRIFAKLENDPWDKLLLDSKEAFSGEKKAVKTLYAADFEAAPDSVGMSRAFAHSGDWSLAASPVVEYSQNINLPRPADLKAGDWLHIGGWFYGEQLEHDTWRMPQLVVRFEKAGEVVRERALRPFRVMQLGQWLEVGMDIRAPQKDFDTIKIFVWNAGSRAGMWVDDLKIETFED
ncbi:MAG: glycosyltransferase family 39 protein [Saprospiraceae bacterium]|nr:glycosyltransferase family 39 protein [Saprospiraceae bacterium]